MAKGKVFETIINFAGEINPGLGKAVKGVEKQLKGINLKAIAVGGAIGGIAVSTGKAVWEAGEYLVDLGSQFDGAIDAIRIGTGATGESLDALVEDMEEVYKSVPTTMEDASQAIADYNTRLGLTGEDLQTLSKQAIQVSDMLGDDLGTVIEESSQAFQQWNIDADDMGSSMDYLFKVSQSTGIGFSDLAGNMQSYGAQLQDMGYSFEEAAALMGQLEKAGVNTEEVLSAMKKSVTTLAKDGIEASEGLALYCEQIQAAGTEAEAAAIASEIFGARAGSTMAAAIRDGSLSMEDLTSELLASKETISGAAEDTYDFAEMLQLFKQNAEVALAPLANTVFDGLNSLMLVGQDLMDDFIPLVEEATEAAMPFVEEFLVGAVDVAKMLSPQLRTLASTMLPILSKLASDLLPPTLNLVSALLPPLMSIISTVLPPLTSLLLSVLPILTNIASMILPVIVEILAQFMPSLAPIFDVGMMLLNDVFMPLFPILTEVALKLLPPILGLVESLLPALVPIVGVLGDLAGVLGTIVGWLAQVVAWVAQGLTWVVDLIFGDGSGDIADAAAVNGYAAGGFTDGLSIAGEDPRYPTEAVISFNPAYRAANLSYWAQAGRMLGADASDFTLSGGGGSSYSVGTIQFAPNIHITGDASKQDVLEAIEEAFPEFVDMLDRFYVERGAVTYGH